MARRRNSNKEASFPKPQSFEEVTENRVYISSTGSVVSLNILLHPDSSLRKYSIRIKDSFDDDLISDMLGTMYAHKGVGLAAPQVGVNKRIIVLDWSWERKTPIVLINPEIVEAEGTQITTESCLSVPSMSADVERSWRVKVRGLDERQKKVEYDVEGFPATIFQHEIDHLEGILYFDHLDKTKQNVFLKRYNKLNG